MKNNLEKNLDLIKPRDLSKTEIDQLWQRVQSDINKPVATNNFLLILIHKPMMQIVLIIILLFGGSAATVAASNSAKPGDWLFPIDRAVENVQIKLSSDVKKDELKVKFAQERAEEVAELLAENPEIRTNTFINSTSTVITNSTTTKNSVESISDAKIQEGYAVAFDYLSQVKSDLEAKGNTEAVAAVDEIINQLNDSASTLPAEVKVEVEKEKDKHKMEFGIKTEDGKQEVKVESDGNKSEHESESVDGKLKVKVEDNGQIKIETENHSDLNTSDSDSDYSSDGSSDNHKEDNDNSNDNHSSTYANSSSETTIISDDMVNKIFSSNDDNSDGEYNDNTNHNTTSTSTDM